ncbi:hypothetical protein LCGC14_1026830 [marine sediment metagenome]|uniref:Uncharacterized protein n=1 Tax=marine sediment metagenome TaxID=412755 RepID=A0A0F9QDW4_9ZZZZ
MRLVVLLIIGTLVLSGCSAGSSGYKNNAGDFVATGTCPDNYKISEESDGRLRCTVFKETQPLPLCPPDLNCVVHEDIAVDCPLACVEMFK